MNKHNIKALLRQGADEKNRILCRTYFKYDENYFYFFPLEVSDKFFLGVEEDDFILDGYTIRRIKDIKKVEHKNDICLEILKKEGVTDNIEVPDIKLKSWKSIFKELRKMDRNIIIEKEYIDGAFYIGRIEEVYSDYLIFRHFDGDGNWLSRPYRIFYEHITSVTWGSRYVDIFSKYIGEPPEETEEHDI